MQRYVWTLIVPMFLGCGGKHVVSGEDKTQAEQLAEDLPSWCEQACQRTATCGGECDCAGDDCSCSQVDDDCAIDCAKGLAGYGRNEACAESGRALQRCFDGLTCEQVTSKDGAAICFPAGSEDTCLDLPPQAQPENPKQAGSGGTGGDDYGSSTGGTLSYAGSASGGAYPTGGSSGSGGSGGGAPVTCEGVTTNASAGAPNTDQVSHLTCDAVYDVCSDLHEYSWICVQDPVGKNWCTCYLDFQPVGMLSPAQGCPSLPEVNAACAWNLREF